MSQVQTLAILIAAAYVVGSIPFGLIVGLARGVDVRKAGSGNIGATNVGRLLGGRYFALVFALDACKSLIPMAAAGVAIRWGMGGAGAEYGWKTYLLWLGVGFAAIMGHMFPVFLGFKGGKGVATTTGVALGLYPYFTLPAGAAIAIWAIVFLGWRYVSLASIVAAAAFPAAYCVIGGLLRWPILSEQLPLLAFAITVAALVIARHRGNIGRLLAGTEQAFRR